MFSADLEALSEARVGESLRARAATFAGVIGKPFEYDELVDTSNAVLAVARTPWQRLHPPRRLR